MAPITISPELIAQFKAQGFLVIRREDHGLVTAEALQSWTNEVRTWPREQGKWMPYDEITADGKRQLLRTEKFVDYHESFQALLCGDDLTGILKQLSGDDMVLFKDKINYKLPNGNGFAAHLDAPAYDHIGYIEHLTANLAVDAATIENGCVEVVPGSHKMDVELANGGRISDRWELSHDWVPVTLEPGDLLMFGSHLAHRSGPNYTTASRSSIYATYHGKSDGDDLRTKYYKDRRLNFPPDHERDPMKNYDEGWKRYGFAAPFSNQPGTGTPHASNNTVAVS